MNKKTKHAVGKVFVSVLATALCAVGIYSAATTAGAADSGSLSKLLLEKCPNHYSLAGAEYDVHANDANGAVVGKLVTNADGTTNEIELDPGTYAAVEVKAPKGFVVHNPFNGAAGSITVAAGDNATFEVSDPSTSDPDLINLKKVDGNQGSAATGDASLSGAVYRVNYYDADFTNPVEREAHPIVATADYKTNDEGEIFFGEDSEANGTKWLFKNEHDGESVWPLGTITIQEITPPDGYTLDPTIYVANVTAGENGIAKVSRTWSNKFTNSPNNPAALETPIKGQVEITKKNVETSDAGRFGKIENTSGAEFTIYNQSKAPVTYDGKLIPVGSVVTTLKADENGHAATPAKSLEYGTYLIKETKAPEGMLLGDFSQTFQVREDGQQFTYEATNQGIRGDFKFVKLDSDSKAPMPNVAFLITSKTTGERHLVVTNEKGEFNSSAYKHSDKTNANDAAIVEDAEGYLTVDSSKLDPTAGVWFYGRKDKVGAPNDELGAFPIDTYTVKELRCDGNMNHQLIEDREFIVTTHKEMIDFADIDNETVTIKTTALSDGQTHTVHATEKVTVTDTVAYTGLHVGKTYRVTGELHKKNADGTDGGVLTDDNGKPITAERDFTPESKAGTYTLTFTFDAVKLAGVKAVAFEDIYDGKDHLGVHANIADEDQTVNFPKIHTTAKSEFDDKSIPAEEQSKIVDTVTYENLRVGETYTVSGTVHINDNGTDAGTVTTANGEEATSAVTFTAEQENGTIDLTYIIDATKLQGKKLVVFEDMKQGDYTVAVHKDINDEGQSVVVPNIGTTLTDTVDDTHQAYGTNPAKLVDKVKYTGLVPGKEYTMHGNLMIDGEDSGITSETTFTPETPDGMVEVVFEYDATPYIGKTVVAFEDVSRDGHTFAIHHDLEDENQAVHHPIVDTEMLTSDGLHMIEPGKNMVFTDHVWVKNALDGEYQVDGVLHVKDLEGKDRGILLNDGKVFNPETGNVEELEPVKKPSKVEDGKAEETPNKENTAKPDTAKPETPKVDDDKLTPAPVVDNEKPEVIDADKETPENGVQPSESDSKPTEATDLDEYPANAVRSTGTFTVANGEGETEVKFEFDGSNLEGYAVVAHQTVRVKTDDKLGKIVGHEFAITNDKETVMFPTIETEATRDQQNKTLLAEETQVINDKVSYKNLEVGKEYTATGVLHVKDSENNDLGLLKNDGTVWKAKSDDEKMPDDVVKSTVTFTAETKDGFVDVPFTVNLKKLAGHTIVAFEDLDHNGLHLATHADINDESQSTYVVKIGTTLTDNGGNKEVDADSSTTLVDTVKYEGLEPGHTYKLKGALVSKDDPDLVVATQEADFTPEAANGQTELAFTLDTSKLGDYNLVAFEEVYEPGTHTAENGEETQVDALVATHKDINDKGQTVHVKKPPVPPIPQLGGGVEILLALAFAGATGGYLIVSKKDGDKEEA